MRELWDPSLYWMFTRTPAGCGSGVMQALSWKSRMSTSCTVNSGGAIFLSVWSSASPSSIADASFESDHPFQFVEIVTMDRNTSNDRVVDSVITLRSKRNFGSLCHVSLLVHGPSRLELSPKSSSSTRIATSNNRMPSGAVTRPARAGNFPACNAATISLADWYRAAGAR